MNKDKMHDLLKEMIDLYNEVIALVLANQPELANERLDKIELIQFRMWAMLGYTHRKQIVIWPE